MRSLTVILVALGAMLIACTTSASLGPGLTPPPAATATLVPSPTDTLGPTPAATATLVPLPTATPGPTPEATVTLVPSPTATPGPTPAPTATLVPTATSIPSPKIVQIEFPDWVDEYPRFAKYIANSAVVARARYVSVDSVVEEHGNYGHIVVMLYKFRIVEYMKGNGPRELTVSLDSGPKYIAFPDWLDHRTEEEARELAENWLNRSRGIFADRGEGVLLLHGSVNDYSFVAYEDGQGYGDRPVIGETWLNQADDLTYRHKFSGEDGGVISLAELEARIEYMEPLMAGEYSTCVYWTLNQRDDVRSQIEGTYRELTLGGYREPEPFPRYSVTIDADKSEVFLFRRPPYKAPRFSDYWLDGEDKDLFAIYTRSYENEDSELLSTIDAVYAYLDLPEGEYSVHYSQYHRSLPCDVGWGYGGWRSADTTEWVVEVIAP